MNAKDAPLSAIEQALVRALVAALVREMREELNQGKGGRRTDARAITDCF
jgi:hypothetical protein